ncbi:MAG: DsbA family protein [Bradyrhizobium sp.]|nr:MAG: DsbA family protein [Bradyrhizobium sp.]
MPPLRQVAARLAPACALALVAMGLPAPAASDDEFAAALMQPGPLPDIVEGAPDAPATIVEYASMTCSHCADFAVHVWPALKVKYIDTGKAKFILREFPIDPLAIIAFMTARCLGPDKRDAMIDKLFADQNDWAFRDEPIERLRRETGLSPEDFLACVKDKTLFDGVSAIHDSAAARFGVDSTPTFFINGRRMDGEPQLEQFDQALASLGK